MVLWCFCVGLFQFIQINSLQYLGFVNASLMYLFVGLIKLIPDKVISLNFNLEKITIHISVCEVSQFIWFKSLPFENSDFQN